MVGIFEFFSTTEWAHENTSATQVTPIMMTNFMQTRPNAALHLFWKCEKSKKTNHNIRNERISLIKKNYLPFG